MGAIVVVVALILFLLFVYAFFAVCFFWVGVLRREHSPFVAALRWPSTVMRWRHVVNVKALRSGLKILSSERAMEAIFGPTPTRHREKIKELESSAKGRHAEPGADAPPVQPLELHEYGPIRSNQE
jgi:hypothetical protein